MLGKLWNAFGHLSTALWLWSGLTAALATGVAWLSGYDPLLIFLVGLGVLSATLTVLYHAPLIANRIKGSASGFMPMPDAMTDAYTRLRTSQLGQAAQQQSRGNPDAVLDFLAISFGSHFPVFGRRPPSTELDEIPESVRKNQGRFVNGAKHFAYDEAGQPSWRDLAARRADVASYVGMFRDDDK